MWNVSVLFLTQPFGLLVPGFAISTISVFTFLKFFELRAVCDNDEVEFGVVLISSNISISGPISEGNCCVPLGKALSTAA